MRRDARWWLLALMVGAGAIGAWAWTRPWVSFSEPVRFYLPYDVEPGIDSPACWLWLATLLVIAGIAFVAIAGRPREYLPETMSGIGAVLALLSGIALAIVIHRIHGLDSIEAYGLEESSSSFRPFSISLAGWAAPATAFIAALGAGGLYRIARRIRLASARELAAVSLE